MDRRLKKIERILVVQDRLHQIARETRPDRPGQSG